MNIVKSFFKGIYYFCVGVNATYHDIKESLTDRRAVRRLYYSTLSVTVAGTMVLLGSCGKAPVAQVSEDASVSETVVSEVSSEEALSSESTLSVTETPAPAVELSAGATKFVEMDAEKLAQASITVQKEYQKTVAAAKPTLGDLPAWQKVNKDVKAWISIPNTNINYPVLYNANTSYYLSRNVYKQWDKNGVIWLDADTRFNAQGGFASTNTIVIGHNWKNVFSPIKKDNPNHTRFEQLAAYHYEDWGKQHPYIYMQTPQGVSKYQVFSVFYTRPSREQQWWYAEYKDTNPVNPTVAKSPNVWPNSYANVLGQALGKSLYNFNTPVSANDKIITLYTCTRVLGPGEDQRFVVMAKKVA